MEQRPMHCMSTIQKQERLSVVPYEQAIEEIGGISSVVCSEASSTIEKEKRHEPH